MNPKAERASNDPRLGALDFVARKIREAVVRSSGNPGLRVVPADVEAHHALETVYVAHPPSTFGTERERRCLAVISEAYCGARIINPGEEFKDGDERRERWPYVLFSLDAVVAFGDDGGWIDRNTFVEIVDAVCSDIAVTITDGMRRVGAGSIELLLLHQRFHGQFARLVVWGVVFAMAHSLCTDVRAAGSSSAAVRAR
jgi:hypothetical protein